jgi:hypothetical protein
MVETLTHERFAEHLNQRFEIELDGGQTMGVRLVSATRLGRGGGASRREPFSLIMRGPVSPALPQRTYPVTHQSLGRLEIFLVPIGPDGEGMRYEAIFS